MKLTDLFAGVPYRAQADGAPPLPEREIRTVAGHTEQEIGADTLFFCLQTPVLDGYVLALGAYGAGCRTFAAERGLALPADATVLIVDDVAETYAALAVRLAGNAFASLTVCGVAGPRGKTTVIRMAEHVLQKAGISTASLTDEGVLIAGRLSPRAPRVPDAGEVVRFLTEAAASGAETAFLECSAYMLAQKAFFYIPFAAVCVMGEPVETDAGETAQLLSSAPFLLLPAGSTYRGQGRVLTFGKNGDLAARDPVDTTVRGIPGRRFLLSFGQTRLPVCVPVIGEIGTENALAALGLCALLDVPPVQAVPLLATARPCGCLQSLARGKPFFVFRDSAFDAPRLARALRAVRTVTAGRLIVVIGSVGGRAEARRAPLGLAAYTYADEVILTADDPDDEPVSKICREMTAELPDIARVRVIPDRAAAIRTAVRALRKGDTLLLAGKGGQTTQLIGGAQLPFDEARIVKEALEGEK